MWVPGCFVYLSGILWTLARWYLNRNTQPEIFVMNKDQASPWMFRYAVGLALCVLVLIVLGAALTSEIQPLPGADVPVVSASTPGEISLEQGHMSRHGL